MSTGIFLVTRGGGGKGGVNRRFVSRDLRRVFPLGAPFRRIHYCVILVDCTMFHFFFCVLLRISILFFRSWLVLGSFRFFLFRYSKLHHTCLCFISPFLFYFCLSGPFFVFLSFSLTLGSWCGTIDEVEPAGVVGRWRCSFNRGFYIRGEVRPERNVQRVAFFRDKHR